MSREYARYAQTRVPFASVHGIERMKGVYQCPELTTQPARPDATTALAHPSRRGNQLHWPDGRVTDLNGIAIPQFVNPA